MRDLKTPIVLDKEAIVGIEIDPITNQTKVVVASGYAETGQFISMERGRSYTLKGVSEPQDEIFYFNEVDRLNSPGLIMYGLLYRAKQPGVFILYSSKPGGPFEVVVKDKIIEFKIDPLVTTNQEIVDAINANPETLELIYEPEVLDIDADVDAPGIPSEIKD